MQPVPKGGGGLVVTINVKFHHLLLCMNAEPSIENVFKHVCRRRC